MNFNQYKTILSFVLFLFMTIGLFGQKGSIKGRVYNSQTNEPLPFTNIIIYGTTIGSTTDLDGNFLFYGIEPGFVKLAVSSVGYETKVTEEFMVTNAKTFFIEIPMTEMKFELNEVVVKASPFARSDESPVSLRRLSISEIERNPGGNRDISKVIQSLPGVAFTPSFRNDVIIRGGGPNENRFFLDGMEIPNLNHFATQGASGGPLGMLNVDFIREVEMYSGAFPANRGNALSSIFDFKQLNGSPDKMNVRATVGASDLALTLNGPISSNTSVIASARRSYLQLLFTALGLPFLPTYNDFQFKTTTKFGTKGELNFIGLGAVDQFKLNLKANETEEQRFILGYLPVSEQWNYAIGSVYKSFGKNGFNTWVISRNMLRNFSYKYPGNDESLNRSFDYVSDEIENKIRFERNTRINNIRLVYGAGAEYAKYSSDTYQELFLSDQPFIVDYDSFIDLFKWSMFGQISKKFLSDKLSLSFGIRTDANSYSSSMMNMLKQLSPRFSASYSLRDNLYVNFNTGRFYQQPSYTTLGYKNPAGVLINKENDLKYIAVDHIVAGLEWLPTEDSKITVEGFYKNYDKYPFSVADSVSIGSKSASFGIFGNEEVLSTGQGRAYGAELLYREQMIKGFSIILSYTLVRSEFKDAFGSYIPSSWDNRHIVNLTVQKKLPRNWDIGAKWRFSGGTPYTPYDMELSSIKAAWDARGQGYLDYSRFNSERIKPFHQLDVRVDKQFYLDKWSLMLYFDVQNVYNFKSRQADDIIQARDENGNPIVYTDEFGVQRYQLKTLVNEIGTVLPSIGIILEF